MNKTVERMARALCYLDSDTENNWEAYVNNAKVVTAVALQSLREPEESMVDAGYEVVRLLNANAPSEALLATVDAWRAMIDAAIKKVAP